MKPCQPDERLCNLLGTKGKNSRFTNFNLNINKELLWWLPEQNNGQRAKWRRGRWWSSRGRRDPGDWADHQGLHHRWQEERSLPFLSGSEQDILCNYSILTTQILQSETETENDFLAFMSEFCNFCSLWYNSSQLLHTISRIPSHTYLLLQKPAHANPDTKPNLCSKGMLF